MRRGCGSSASSTRSSAASAARVRTFPRGEVKELIREADSLMPAFVMPSTDVDNLVAYLKSKK